MNITNVYNLPAPLVSAIVNDPYDKVGDISINGLIRPPQMRILEKRHDAEVTQDATEFIWRLFGQAMHTVLERSDTHNHLSEERMVTEVLGWQVSGKPDLLDPEMTLWDYKITSVYSFLLGEKPEWETQLNLYRWLYAQHGFLPRRLAILAILRDWSKRRAQTEPDYPKIPVFVSELPLWPLERAQGEVERLVKIHQAAEHVPDGALPPCSPQERWEKPTIFAVKKKGNKRAMNGGLHKSLISAEDMVAQIPGTEIEMRPGESVRCEDYCPVKNFCSQYAAAASKRIQAA